MNKFEEWWDDLSYKTQDLIRMCVVINIIMGSVVVWSLIWMILK